MACDTDRPPLSTIRWVKFDDARRPTPPDDERPGEAQMPNVWRELASHEDEE